MKTVYKIKYQEGYKSYIGQTEEFDKRLYYHFSGQGKLVIHKAIKKYGKEKFSHTALCFCHSKEQLNEQEKFYIWYYNTISPNGYNRTLGGDSHTEESKRKIGLSMKGKKPWNKGISLPCEMKDKIRNSHMGERNHFFGKKHSEDSKQKMSIAKIGRPSPIKGIKVTNIKIIKRLSDSHCKFVYNIIDPIGNVFITNNLFAFCEEKKIIYSSMILACRKGVMYKGWEIKRSKPPYGTLSR